MRSLYVPNLKEGLFNLSEDESRHAVRVLRAKVGYSYTLMDGKGGSAEAEIIEITKNSCLLKVGEISVEGRPLFGLTMIVAPTKNTERFEWFLEKATSAPEMVALPGSHYYFGDIRDLSDVSKTLENNSYHSRGSYRAPH